MDTSQRKYSDILTEAFLRERYVDRKQSTNSIGKETGISPKAIRNYLIYYDIPRRTSAESNHRHLDSSGFIDLSTDWHAYWTGFLAADGCVFKDPKRKNVARVQLILKISDADHIRNLQQGLGAEVPVKVGFNGQRDIAKIIFFDSQLIDALAKWGIVPNKTLTMPWPDHLPSERVSAFIRGYFDGDGTIYQRHRTASGTSWTETNCRFISGSVPFLQGLERELNKRGIGTTKIYRNQTSNAFVLPLSSKRENLLAFAKLIYQDSTVCLERKHAIFREMEEYHAAHPRKGSHLRYQAG